MNPLYTFAEESRLTAAAIAEARHLRALAPAVFWSAAGRWVGRRSAPSGKVIEGSVAPLEQRAGRVQ